MIEDNNETRSNFEEGELFSAAADKLISSINEILRTAKTEEDLRIGFEKSLEPILKSIGIDTKPIYESLGIENKSIYRGRPDAIHGQIIIEYEPPDSFCSDTVIIHAYEQLKNYMLAKAKGEKTGPVELLKRIVGVGFDGKVIFFIRYQARSNGKPSDIDEKLFIQYGPFLVGTYCRVLATGIQVLFLHDRSGKLDSRSD